MKKAMTFEADLARLEEILALLQSEETPLADAVKLYAEAAGLVAGCEETLRKATLEIEQIDVRLGHLNGETAE